MDTPLKKPGVSSPTEQVGNESHYHSKKDRIFVRAIQGPTASRTSSRGYAPCRA